MNTKLFYWIGSVLLVLLLGVFGYIWYRSTNVVQVDNTTSTLPEVVSTQGELIYRNNTYGFSVLLPSSWRGYSITEKAQDSYLEIRIVHPQSTTENPRMDVPVLVVPIATWNTWYPSDRKEDGRHPFAAPIPATERARNTKYVFATAPRYNFSYLPGWEEVDEIVKGIKGLAVFMSSGTAPVEPTPLFQEGEIKG